MQTSPFLSVLSSETRGGIWYVVGPESDKSGPPSACGAQHPEKPETVYFYDRKLLSELSRCGWGALKTLYTIGLRD